MVNGEILTIRDWELGIADSPHKGFGLLRNADIESYPGALKVSKLPQSFFPSITTRTFTADASTDLCTASGSIEANGNTFMGAAVYFTTTGTLPAGLSLNTVYYLSYVSGTTFKVCTSYKNSVGSSAGTFVNITDAGTGTHTLNMLSVGTINWIVKDNNSGGYFMMSSNGRVWLVTSGASTAYLLHNSAIENVTGSLTNASGNGLALFRTSDGSATYLFAFRNAVIDVISVGSSAAIEALAWSNSWKSMNSSAGGTNSHHAITAQDNIIYFCDDRYVGSIRENAASIFDPGNAATYTYNNQALDLPNSEIAQCLEEMGTNLMIGGNTFNKIYPWDRTSDSFNLPLPCPENSVKRMKNVGNTMYVLAGSLGYVYATQGTYVRTVRRLPTYIFNNSFTLSANPITWGGIASTNSGVIFGVGGTSSGSSGLFLMYPDGRLVQDNTPLIGSTNVVGLYAENNFYLMGYAGGADNFNNGALYANYNTVAQSPLYRVGNKTQKATCSEIEVQMAKPASTGHFRAKYRRDTSSSFVDFSEAVTGTADGTTTSWSFDAGVIDIENIQVQVEMDGQFELMQVVMYE